MLKPFLSKFKKSLPDLIINESGYKNGAPQVRISKAGKKILLEVVKSGTGKEGSYWGLRYQPELKNKIQGEVIKFNLELEFDGEISLSRMLVKICDGFSCTERVVDSSLLQQSLEIYHTVHLNAEKIHVDINLGEWRHTRFITPGKIFIKQYSLEIAELSVAKNQHLSIGEHVFSYDKETYKNNIYLDKLALTFPEKIHCFYHNNPEMKVVPSLISPDELVIDAGANWGIYTVLFAAYAKAVWAFEPNPDVFTYLTRTTAAYKNVYCFPVALGDSHDEVKLFLSKSRLDNLLDSGGASIASKEIAKQGTENFDEYPVPLQVLDALQPQNVGFIKIDVEGAELAVLKGAEQTIKKYFPTILIEIFDQWTDTCAATIEFLKSHHYEIFFYCEPTKSFMPLDKFDFELYYQYFSGYTKKNSIYQYVQNFICINRNRPQLLMKFIKEFAVGCQTD